MQYSQISRISIIALVMIILGTSQVFARQFRPIKPIATPNAEDATLPEGAMQATNVIPVPRAVVKNRVSRIVEKWNTPEMAETLAEEFYDRTRLLDVVDGGVPRDARLRMQSLQGTQTLQQYHLPDPDGRPKEVSIVSATVRTQLEYNSPTGFVRLPGTNEFIFKVTRTP